MDINALLGDPKHQMKDGCGEPKQLGTLELDYISIKYTMLKSAIYANCNHFCGTFGNSETAGQVFIQIMRAIFGEDFQPYE